jgi:hypothetical protein
MITSAQIIAHNQIELAAKMNILLQYVPDTATEFMTEIVPFGANQFVIVITWNQVGGTRTFSNNANASLQTRITKLPNKAVRPKIGLLASIKLLYNELFLLVPKLGLKTVLVRNLVMLRRASPILGETTAFRAKQKPTREKPMVGMIIVPAKKKNGSTIAPF